MPKHGLTFTTAPPHQQGGTLHCCILLLTSIEKCELFFCLFYHGDIHWPIFDILHNVHVSVITHLIEKGERGQGREGWRKDFTVWQEWMYYRGFFGFKEQKPSGFNLKGQRADLFLGRRMSNRIQRKVGFLTLGKGQKKSYLLSVHLSSLIRASLAIRTGLSSSLVHLVIDNTEPLKPGYMLKVWHVKSVSLMLYHE